MASNDAPAADEALLWGVRAFVYRFWAARCRPPTVAETGRALGLPTAQAESIYRALHDRHAFLLEPGTSTIRMANPFAAVETPFRVRVGEREYFANCAWDALGIPSALHADVEIAAHCAESGEPLRFGTVGDTLIGDDALIHFLLPFRSWYDDLVYT